jgi:hypothetical protein
METIVSDDPMVCDYPAAVGDTDDNNNNYESAQNVRIAEMFITLLQHPAFTATRQRQVQGLSLIDLSMPLTVYRARRELLPPMPDFPGDFIENATGVKMARALTMADLGTAYQQLVVVNQVQHPIYTVLEHLLFNDAFANLVAGPIQFHYDTFYNFACYYPHFNAVIKEWKYKNPNIIIQLFQNVLIPLMHALYYTTGQSIQDILRTLMHLFPFLVRKTPNKQRQLVDLIVDKYREACEKIGSSASLLNLSSSSSSLSMREKKQTNLGQFYITSSSSSYSTSPESEKE